MAAKPLPPIEFLRKVVMYDPDEGSFRWLQREASTFKSSDNGKTEIVKKWNARNAGGTAFATKMATGHLKGRINEEAYLAHRLAWKMYYGLDPKGEIDHINGNPADNRITNLRDVPHKINQRNRALDCDNTSGVVGVQWSSKRQRWVAQIVVGGRRSWLGQYTELADAAAARKTAERLYGFHENHGRDRVAA